MKSKQALLDQTDWHILRELQQDARLSWTELGRRVGLSSPAAQERVRKLEDAGVIEGYRAVLNLPQVGLPIMAFVRVGNLPTLDEQRLEKLVCDMDEVLECHHITGEDCFIVKIGALSIPHLESVIARFSDFTHTTTGIVLSSPIQNRIITDFDGL